MYHVVVCRVLTGRVTRYSHPTHESACRHAARRAGRNIRVWVEPDPSYLHIPPTLPEPDEDEVSRMLDEGCPNVG